MPKAYYYLRWPQGREKAITLSYDDGVEKDRRLVSLMKQHGFRQETQPNAVGQLYSKGKFSLRFADDAIHISVKVSNLLGIQF